MTTSMNADNSLTTAAGYSKAANLLMKYIGKTRSAEILPSMIVLRSLALEIYLKRLYTLEHHKPYEGHHLKQIFEALSEETRRKVTEYYDRSLAESSFIKHTLAKHQEIKGGVPKLDLEHVLHEWSEVMTDRRYFFEPKHNVVFLAFAEIENALTHRLKDISPEAESGPSTGQQKSVA